VCCLCGGVPWRLVVKVHAIGRMTVKRPMGLGLVVERQVACSSLLGRSDGLVGVEIQRELSSEVVERG
jgi:hypothetical protein